MGLDWDLSIYDFHRFNGQAFTLLTLRDLI